MEELIKINENKYKTKGLNIYIRRDYDCGHIENVWRVDFDAEPNKAIEDLFDYAGEYFEHFIDAEFALFRYVHWWWDEFYSDMEDYYNFKVLLNK
tara:strand:- start:1440 stop:1724 length:285 start_codon:yes stop_codon:yes gene_type:complete